MTISRLRKSQGFTLIEIMIAIFLLVVAMLGVISVTVMVIKGNSFSKTMTTATTLAADKMEELKNKAYRQFGGRRSGNAGIHLYPHLDRHGRSTIYNICRSKQACDENRGRHGGVELAGEQPQRGPPEHRQSIGVCLVLSNHHQP